MAIRGYSTKQVHTTQYSQAHIKSVVKSLGLNVLGESNNNLVLYCPFHNNTHTPCFYISSEKGAWLCFNPSCGESGNLVDLVKRILNKNDFEAIRFIATKELEAVDNFEEDLQALLEDKPEFEEFPESILIDLHNGIMSSEIGKDYFNSRGINLDSISTFSLGYSEKQNMVTVPVHSPDGVPIGIVGRSVSEKRFKNSTNLAKNKTLFNLHRAKRIGDHIIIVESSFDAIRVHQSGFPNVVATLGGHLSPEQHHLLNRYFNKITIMTDADEAGRQLGLSIANKLRNKNILWASYSYGKIYPHDAKDAGDMTEEEIKDCIKNAVSDIEYRSWK
jgi:DNA primase